MRLHLRDAAKQKVNSFSAIVGTLIRAVVRNRVAGALAANAHDYSRFTHNVELIERLGLENTLPALAALVGLGCRHLTPLTAAQFADPVLSAARIREKDATALNFHCDRHWTATVDIFVSDQFDFDTAYARALRAELSTRNDRTLYVRSRSDHD